MSEYKRKLRTNKFDKETNKSRGSCNSRNGWVRAVYMTCMSQNYRLFRLSNLSVLSFVFICSSKQGRWWPASITLTARAAPGVHKWGRSRKRGRGQGRSNNGAGARPGVHTFHARVLARLCGDFLPVLSARSLIFHCGVTMLFEGETN